MSEPAPAADAKIRMRLNGREIAADGSRAATLADLLRETCGLTGTKIGCETGDCGACVILVDGRQALACLTPALRADGREITTIEQRDDPLLERLRRAFADHGAGCGFCAPGLLISSLDLLRRAPKPSRRRIAEALGGIRCGCGGALKAIDAVEAVANGGAEKQSAPAGALNVGRSMQRIDAQRAMEGATALGDDGAPHDCLFVRAIRCPFPRAAFAAQDIEAWRATHPGVAAVITAADIAGVNLLAGEPHARPLFAQGEARFRGDIVAAIVGERDALARLSPDDGPFDWTPLPPLTDAARAADDGVRAIDPRRSGNVAMRAHLRRGHVAAGHAQGSLTVEGEFETSAAAFAAVSEKGWAEWGGDGVLSVHVGARAYAACRDRIAAMLAVPAHAVRIVPTQRAGGGACDPATPALLALACAVTKRPVRLCCAPSESVAAAMRRPARINARVSAAADGRLVAFEMRGDFNAGAYLPDGADPAGLAALHAAGPYAIAHVRCRTRAILTNEPPAAAGGAAGRIEAAIAAETLLDELAERIGMDRWAFRRLNAIGHGDMTPTGQTLAASAGLPQCLDALKLDWEQAMWEAQMQNATHAERYRRGVGVACLWSGCGALSESGERRARLTLDRDGRLVFRSDVQDFGDGALTALVQIMADELGMPTSAFECETDDDTPARDAPPHFFVAGRAAMLAARDMRRKILRLANMGSRARLSLKGRELQAQEGETRRSIDLGAMTHEKGVVFSGDGVFSPAVSALDWDGQGAPFAAYSFGAQIAEVEVDMLLGRVKVLHVAAAQDVGRAVNPQLTEDRIRAAVTQGVGVALMQETDPGHLDAARGRIAPGVAEAPRVTVRLIEDREPDGAFGAKSLGGSALIATAPAILNAIRHATGVAARKIPLRPDRLWEAMRLRGA